MSKFIDMKGKRCNRWTVLCLDSIKNKRAFWLCECECGTRRVVSGTSLRNGGSKSCGCIINDCYIKKANGLSKTRINNIYHNMKYRCNNVSSPYYKNYGGRGIKICAEWLDKEKGFLNFYNWAMQNGYQEDLTIDRIDVNGNYEPNNCRWIPLSEQVYNRTNNVFYIVNNQKKCLSQLCKEYDMPYHTVKKRLQRGKDIITALTTPIDIKKRNKLYKGKE